jgi:hypothetical protein
VKFTSASVAGDSPTNAELEMGVNWMRVLENKDVRIVAVTHNNSVGPLWKFSGIANQSRILAPAHRPTPPLTLSPTPTSPVEPSADPSSHDTRSAEGSFATCHRKMARRDRRGSLGF